MSEKTAPIEPDGNVNVSVTLTNSTEEAGLNYITVVVEEDVGETGLMSDIAILRYHPNATPLLSLVFLEAICGPRSSTNPV